MTESAKSDHAKDANLYLQKQTKKNRWKYNVYQMKMTKSNKVIVWMENSERNGLEIVFCTEAHCQQPPPTKRALFNENTI